jgi:predicted ATPase
VPLGEEDHPEVLRSWDEVRGELEDATFEPAEREAPDYEQYGLDSVRNEVAEVLGYLREPTLLAPGRGSPLSTERLESHREFDMRSVRELFAEPATRLYLIDEPEQRLHPALQRRAARWLSTAMRQWDAQCILATHAIPFIDLPGEHDVYELARDGQQSDIRRVDPATLTLTIAPGPRNRP